MLLKKHFLLIIFVLGLFLNSKAQVEEESINSIETIIENIASNIDADIDYTTLYDQLIQLYYNKIDLNTCTKEDLQKLYFINNFQIEQFMRYRKKYGKLVSIYELQLIKGFNNDIILQMLPFVTVTPQTQKQPRSLKNTFKYGKSQVFMRYQQVLETQQGYVVPDSEKTESNHYLGSPARIYAKYKFKYADRVQFGITADKDAGEEFFKGSQPYGFDFYSAHVQINNIGIVKKVVVGDFLAQFGQGLTLYRGLSFNKSTDVLNIMKKPSGIRAYTSSNELEYFRGGAFTVGKNNWAVSAFYSNHNVDGTIKADTSQTEEEYINSIITNSNHATPSGIAKKNTINEQAFGGNATYSFNRLRLGLTGVYSKYSVPLLPSDEAYKVFGFQGNDNLNIGMDYQLSLSRYYLFGEYSVDRNFNSAFLSGVNVKVIDQLYLALLYRNYSMKYVNLYANGFGESSSTNNEKGMYSGIVFYPVKSLKLSGYYDFYNFDWLKYHVSAPSNGFDYFVQAEYTPLRDFVFRFYIRQEIKKADISGQTEGVKKQTNTDNTRIRFHLAYKISDNLTLKNRFETHIYKDKTITNSTGYLIYQDISYRPSKLPAVFTGRLAFFDTYDYNSRIYAYENDVLYSFSVPAYYGRGMRYYLLVKYDILKNMSVWLRYSQSVYTDRNVISSGLTEIQGNTKSEVKVQLRYKF